MAQFVDVEKTYDGVTLVIKGLNLSIHDGEFLTLLGPSGSGKTTTLLMLAGFERPTGGRIEIAGRSIEREPAWRRNLGMVFQDYALFPHMSVLENVAFPLSVRKLAKHEARAKAMAALAKVKLSGLEDRSPGQLSGGQQQRVALARALVFGPRLVLMDEPLGALDKQLREQLQLEIKRLQRELGVTVVYVTHDQEEALVMSDRIAVFRKGRICQLDTPQALYERPCDSFVAQFIGENNQLAGRLQDQHSGVARVVLATGPTVLATTVGDAVNAAPGAAVVLSLRPERVVLGDHEAKRAAENAFRARIVEVIYLGDHLRVRLAVVDTSLELLAKVHVGSSPASLGVGLEVDLAWSARDCLALAQT
ncbi:MAG: ABC transporter ATP-binding protein [Burkholderiaceae bacterium]|nr:ABC transporter ATP-binding protein [Burkholderiaceae bacterium]